MMWMWGFLAVALPVLFAWTVLWPEVRARRAAAQVARRREQWDRETAEALAVANETRHTWRCPRPGCGDGGSAPTVAEARRDLHRHVDDLCVFYRRAAQRSVA